MCNMVQCHHFFAVASQLLLHEAATSRCNPLYLQIVSFLRRSLTRTQATSTMPSSGITTVGRPHAAVLALLLFPLQGMAGLTPGLSEKQACIMAEIRPNGRVIQPCQQRHITTTRMANPQGSKAAPNRSQVKSNSVCRLPGCTCMYCAAF